MLPEELYNALKDLRAEEEIKEVAVNFDSWIRKKYSTLESIKTAMIKYNKLIKTIPLVIGENAFAVQNSRGEQVQRHFFYKYAGLKPEEYEIFNKREADKKVKRLDNRTKIEVKRYLDKIGELLVSNDSHELAVGLIAATGRRPHEILVRASFKPVKEGELSYPEHQPETHWLTFEGQGKKLGKAVPYPIATLFPSAFIIKALKRLRNSPECKQLIADIEAEFPNDLIKQNDAIDSRRNTSLNRVVREELADILAVRHERENISCGSLRAAYARLATERDCPPDKNDLMWASRLLGHFSEGGDIRALLTTAGYFDYYIDGEDIPRLGIPNFQERVAFRGYESDVNEVREWMDRYRIPSQMEAFKKIWELAKEAMRVREEKLASQESQESVQVTETSQESEMISEEKLTALIEQIVERKVSEALTRLPEKPKVVPLTRSHSEVAVHKQQSTTVKSEESTAKDWESVPSEELKGSKAPGSAEEKIRRIIKAIMDYNDYTATSNSDRWYIGVRTIQDAAKDAGGSGTIRHDAIKRFLETYGQMVNDHNAKYELSSQHNKRHSAAISSLIDW